MIAKVGILSLGCPRNLVDSENILGRLNSKGYPIVDMEKADIALINTCAFIDDAKRESIDAILDLVELKKRGKLKKIIVYGCLSQRYSGELKKRIPEVDAFIGKVSLNHEIKRFPITPKHYVYLKICEGCINNCSFCAIPKIKGKFTSLDLDSILDKVENFDRDKVSELNIIGQDITAYGIDLTGRTKLIEALERVVKKAKHIGWIRLLYLYPSRVTKELLKLIKDEPKICKYIDLPIQHINSRILKLMNRNTSKTDIVEIIEEVRKIIPDVALRTSLITGFPSETEKEFKELLSFIEETKFERLGAFVYSREEDTAAYNMVKQIPDKVKQERLSKIMSLQQKISRGINEKFMGKTVEVLIDERKGDKYAGRSQYDAPEVDGVVYVNSKKALRPGDFVKVKITDTLEYDLVGESIP
ncbi:MAG: 30S ribosomal protein S12 methylthiotransferase RimO [Candidatus Omnitrophota bacterium]